MKFNKLDIVRNYYSACSRLEEILEILGWRNIFEVTNFSVNEEGHIECYFSFYDGGNAGALIRFPEGITIIDTERFKYHLDWINKEIKTREEDVVIAENKLKNNRKKVAAYREIEIGVPADVSSNADTLFKSIKTAKAKLTKAKKLKSEIITEIDV